MKRSLPTFFRFIEEVQTKPIDGFCFFVAMQPATIEEFAGIVTRVMRAVSDHDPGYSRVRLCPASCVDCVPSVSCASVCLTRR